MISKINQIMLFAFLLLLTAKSNAQIVSTNSNIAPVSSVSVSNLHTTTQALTGTSPTDPLNDSMLVNLSFQIVNLSSIQAIHLNVGTSQEAGDLQTGDIHYFNKNNQDYVEYKGLWFPVIGGLAQIQFVIPESAGSMFLSLGGNDKQGKTITAVSRQIQ